MVLYEWICFCLTHIVTGWCSFRNKSPGWLCSMWLCWSRKERVLRWKVRLGTTYDSDLTSTLPEICCLLYCAFEMVLWFWFLIKGVFTFISNFSIAWLYLLGVVNTWEVEKKILLITCWAIVSDCRWWWSSLLSSKGKTF